MSTTDIVIIANFMIAILPQLLSFAYTSPVDKVQEKFRGSKVPEFQGSDVGTSEPRNFGT